VLDIALEPDATCLPSAAVAALAPRAVGALSQHSPFLSLTEVGCAAAVAASLNLLEIESMDTASALPPAISRRFEPVSRAGATCCWHCSGATVRRARLVLGPAMVKGIAESHGAGVSVESTRNRHDSPYYCRSDHPWARAFPNTHTGSRTALAP